MQRWSCTILGALLYHALGNGGLSLAQRESMEVLAHARGLSQLQQGSRGVHTRGQNKDQRSPAGGLLHNLDRGHKEELELTLETEEARGIRKITADTHGLQVESRRLHKARAEVLNNEGGDAKGDTVLTQGAYDQHPLELIAVTVPVTYK